MAPAQVQQLPAWGWQGKKSKQLGVGGAYLCSHSIFHDISWHGTATNLCLDLDFRKFFLARLALNRSNVRLLKFENLKRPAQFLRRHRGVYE